VRRSAFGELKSTGLLLSTFLLFAGLCAALPAAAQPTLTLYWRGLDEEIQGLQRVVDAWGAERGVSVEVISSSSLSWDEYYDRFAIMAASGVEFDIALLDMASVSLGASGALVDLSPYIERDGLWQATVPAAFRAFSANGKTYGFPYATFPEVMFYRPSLVDSAGLARPATAWHSDAWTWDEFVESAVAMTRDTNGDGLVDQWGYDLAEQTEWVIYAFGARWIDPETGEFDITDPRLLEALYARRMLHSELHVSHQPGDASHGGPGWLPFAGGRVGLKSAGIWLFERLYAAGWDWNIAAMPKASTRASMTTINAFGIGRTSRNPDLAWELIKYLTVDPAGSIAFVSAGVRGLPIGPQGQREFLDTQRSKDAEIHFDTIIEALDFAVIDPFRLSVSYSDLMELRNNTVDRAIAGEMPIETALAEMKRLGDPLIARER
jgi:ABC-type sugar transport system, periplasmic component